MPVVDHLGELRRRLIVSAITLALGTILAFIFSEKLLDVLLLPLKGLPLKAFNIMDGFMIKWRLSVFTGIVLASPVLIFEIYSFIRPALGRQSRAAAWPFILGCTLLFLAGMAFAYYLLFSMVQALLGFFPHQIEYLPSADDYMSFITFFMLACGLVFEFPPVLMILVRSGILSVQTLRKKRKLAYFILFAFAEIITPVSDPIVAPMMVMAPLILLYELSILGARRIEARRAKSEAIENTAQPADAAPVH